MDQSPSPDPAHLTDRPLVLASASAYRSRLLAEAGFEFVVAAPDFDERAVEARPDPDDLRWPERHALELASGKARSVAPSFPDHLVLGADQLAVVRNGTAAGILHKPGNHDRAVAQLLSMSGSTHELVNGVVLLDGPRCLYEVDVQRVTMRTFTHAEATAYVRAYEPFDCAGGYRLEDDAGFVISVDGEDESGVIGLPLPTVRRLLAASRAQGA
ncbi:MAG: Maf family protein [Microthrixaceae bacterium]|nr:Maf family protein [Microthrixaceae bacterium]